jgi:tRNA threonylcarbamoyladenosine biosynthesis protein TsaE
MQELSIISNSPLVTFNFGKRVGKKLPSGSVIALVGELGCGKTLFTRGLCAGLDVPERRVNSPTFVLVNEYQGRLPVFHMDLYRLDNITQEFEIGILDYLVRAESGVMIVEWAEKILSLLPEDFLRVDFKVLSSRQRELDITAAGPKFTALLGELAQR